MPLSCPGTALLALAGAGVVYAELGEYSKAIAVLTKLSEAKPEDPDVLRLLVNFLF